MFTKFKTARVNVTSCDKPFESSPKKSKEEYELEERDWRGSEEPKDERCQPTTVSSEHRLSLANKCQLVDLDDEKRSFNSWTNWSEKPADFGELAQKWQLLFKIQLPYKKGFGRSSYMKIVEVSRTMCTNSEWMTLGLRDIIFLKHNFFTFHEHRKRTWSFKLCSDTQATVFTCIPQIVTCSCKWGFVFSWGDLLCACSLMCLLPNISM